MRTVGLRELKNRLSKCVREVREGRALLVTDRGHVVAELLPPPSGRAHVNGRRRLVELAWRGVVSLGTRNDPKVYRRMPTRLARGELQRLVDQERGDR